MSEQSQVQHSSLLTMGNEELKTLLIGEIGEPYLNCDGNILYPKTEFTEHEEILNKELSIYLVANVTAKTMYYRHNAYAVVTIDLHHGVREWHFDYKGTLMPKAVVHDDIIAIAESARHILEKKYDSIVQEEWQRKYSILESVIGDRSKQLKTQPNFTENCFRDVYTGIPITTVEEREVLKHLGIEVGIFQE